MRNPRQRGMKSLLPPRLAGDRRLDQPRTHGKFIEDRNVSAVGIIAVLREAGWDPEKEMNDRLPSIPLREIVGDAAADVVLKKMRLFARQRTSEEADAVDRKVPQYPTIQEIDWCVRRYLVARQNAVSPKQFRSDLKDFEQAIKSFIRKMPKADSALQEAVDAKIDQTLTSKFLLNRHDLSEIELTRQILEFPDVVESYQLRNLWQLLQTSLAATSSIRIAESGRGKDADRAAHELIANLANIFKYSTGRRPRRINDPTRTKNRAVIGHFGNFVRAVDKQIPMAFRLKDIDNLIRSFVSARSRSL
jgi:hypothetical protein